MRSIALGWGVAAAAACAGTPTPEQAAVNCGSDLAQCGSLCVDVKSDPQNCGDCGVACDKGKACVAGKCALACVGGLSLCGGACVDTKDDPAHCGSCDKTCPTPAGSSPLCTNGQCGFVCKPGVEDCNGKPDDGCEATLAADPKNCGKCGNACPDVAHGKGGCANGTCGVGTCDMGFADCNKDPSDGCETDTTTDTMNCGMCGKQCVAPTPSCQNSACSQLYWATGPQTNVPEAMLGGWQNCYKDTYNVPISSQLANILQKCNKGKLLLACRQNGQPNFKLLAMGNRSDVLFDCGTQPNCTHVANGVGWYFNTSYSWGFVNNNEPVQRNSCDVAGPPSPQLRLCWHTVPAGGYRCGEITGLNGDATWERDIYQAD